MTTRRTMIVVALVAVNCWAFEPLARGRVGSYSLPRAFAIGWMPIFNLLAIAACVARDQVQRRGQVDRFLVGFLVAGWASSVLSLAALLGSPSGRYRFLQAAVDTLYPYWFEYVMTTGEFTRRHRRFVIEILLWVALSLPQILLAVSVGWLAHHLGSTVRGDSRSGGTGGRPIPPRISKRSAAVAGLLSVALVLGATLKGRVEEFGGRARFYAQQEMFAAQWRDALVHAAEWESRASRPGLDGNDLAVATTQAVSFREDAALSRRRLPYYVSLRKKYERLVRYPWLPAPADPPPP